MKHQNLFDALESAEFEISFKTPAAHKITEDNDKITTKDN
jgi:hypothetical protein